MTRATSSGQPPVTAGPKASKTGNAGRATTARRAGLAELASALDVTEADLQDLAERAAGQVQGFTALWQSNGTDEAAALRSLRRVARTYRVNLPAKHSLQQLLNRLCSAAWWRGALRKRFRVVELHEIERGEVHRHASPYVSGKALHRHERNARRLAELLAGMEAVNLDTGEAIPLEELAATSQANPAMRRMAMMARIRGVERWAKDKGHEAHLVTLTAPSRMHAGSSAGGPNPAYDGTNPRQAQTYLGRVWKNATRTAKRCGLTPYGIRTVEPHHDGCPHWHMVIFTPAGQAEPFLRILRAYALADTPNEPGAQTHRFDAKPVDPQRGSAAAYAAKYVAKNIDGHGIEDDEETSQTGNEAARRIVAWARVWGIRQFQFFGLPPITPTRELYRVAEGAQFASQALEAAHEACRAKDYTAYLRTLETHALALGIDYDERPSSRYAGELAKAIHGLRASGADLHELRVIVTRDERWVIQPRAGDRREGADGAPWTRCNNCAPPVGSTGYALSGGTPPVTAGPPAPRRRRRRDEATATAAPALS